MKPRRPVWIWFATAATLIALDQYTKWLVRANFELGGSIAVIGDGFVRLTYVLNPGVAFGLPVPWKTPLLIFGWTAAVVLAVYLFRSASEGNLYRWPALLFFAGAVGNSIDRQIFGEVTDFVDVDFPDFIMERWPVFNVADSCVTVGVVVLLFLILLDHRHSRQVASDGIPAGDSTPQSLPSHDGSRAASGTD